MKYLFAILLIALISCTNDKTSDSKINPDTIANKNITSIGKDTFKAQLSFKRGEYKYIKFIGAWFTIEYPSDFQIKESMKSGGVISAFFLSPDKKVEFYIMSPQWREEPKDIAIDYEIEKMGDRTISIKKSDHSGSTDTIIKYSILAKDNTYSRSYQDNIQNNGSIRWVIGIKYVDKVSYDFYKDDYIKFKKSLQQFAD